MSELKSKKSKSKKPAVEPIVEPTVELTEPSNNIAAEAAPEEPTVSNDIQNDSITDDTADAHAPAAESEVAEPALDAVEQAETPTEDLTYVVNGHAYTPDEIAAMSDGQLYDLIGRAQADAEALKADVEAREAERAEERDDYEHDIKAAQRKQLKELLAAFDAETAGILAAAGMTAAPALIAVLQERNPKLAVMLVEAPVEPARAPGSRGPRHDLAPTVLGLCVDGTTLDVMNKKVKAIGGSVMSQRRFKLTYSKYTDIATDGVITLNAAGRAKLAAIRAA